MNKILALILILSTTSVFAKEERKIASLSFNVSTKCDSEIKKNEHLQAMFRTIKLNVQEYSVNPSAGYSSETGQTLVNMMCKPFESSEAKAKFDLCKDIEENVTAYQKNPQNGFSLETAHLLNKMSGKKCLVD